MKLWRILSPYKWQKYKYVLSIKGELKVKQMHSASAGWEEKKKSVYVSWLVAVWWTSTSQFGGGWKEMFFYVVKVARQHKCSQSDVMSDQALMLIDQLSVSRMSAGLHDERPLLDHAAQ